MKPLKVNIQHKTKSFYDNEQLKEDGFFDENGKKTGEWKVYFEHGQIFYQSNYKNDLLQGKWVSFFSNGKLNSVGYHEKGKQEGEWKWYYFNGNLKTIEIYKNDRKEGLCKYYHENGQLKRVGAYDGYTEIGKHEYYNEDGKLTSIGNCNEDEEMIGEWKYYNDQGELVKTKTFSEDKIITQLELENDTFQVGDLISISFLVKNNTKTNFEFCYWQTPLEKKITADFFELIFERKKLPYKGRMKKRKPPTKADDILLKPDEYITQIININDEYNLSKPGAYTVRFLGRSINGLPNSEAIHFMIVS